MEVGNSYALTGQLKQILNDFLASALLQKPDDIYDFARSYFSTTHATQRKSTNNINATRAFPLVICGPSGVGKGTLIQRLLKEFPDKFGFSVSHTTRAPRPGEVNGVHYNFTTVDAIQKEISEGKFVEHANVHGNYYGTSKAGVEKLINDGKICILDIDVQGCEQIKKSSLPAKYVFIAPPGAPGVEELEKRLRGRGTETEETIAKRLKNAKGEMEYMNKPGFYDFILVNDNLDKAYTDLKDWIFKQTIHSSL